MEKESAAETTLDNGQPEVEEVTTRTGNVNVQPEESTPPSPALMFTEQNNPHDLPSEGQLPENATTVKPNNVQGRWIVNNRTALEKE